MALLDRMHCSYAELMETPAMVVQDAIMDMEAIAGAASDKDRWDGR